MASRSFALLDAPSNLGLRPPAEGRVPGCHRAPAVLRGAGLQAALGAEDAGAVLPPRYEAAWIPGTLRNAAGLASYTPRLADRVGALLDAGRFPVVLGGDCSILLGAGLALARRGGAGLAFLDGHSDFRHPGNASRTGPVGAAAGEDLALVTGRGDPGVTNLEGRDRYFREEEVVAAGLRDDDDCAAELVALGVGVEPAAALHRPGLEAAIGRMLTRLEGVSAGFWIHLDVDILDPAVMPAADAPDPGGIDHDELAALLGALAASPRAVGLDVTVYDPDLDEDGRHGRAIVATLARALRPGV